LDFIWISNKSCTRDCLNETLYIAILNKQTKNFFHGEQEGKTGPIWGWCQWERGEYKERVKEAECSGNILYSSMKMEK
jgi:hypothetical protein